MADEEDGREEVVTSKPVDSRGISVDDVPVEIDYAIIEHFSQHLYGSPNKAIEELVSNSFDAFASATYVYIPGRFTDACVLVWDNGGSMDVAELHKLWWIAQSPKVERGRVATFVDNKGNTRTREMIGKFGIGKLASYVVGHRITHLCRRGEQFRRVSVDYRDVPHLHEDNKHRSYVAHIIELSEKEARDYAGSLFRLDAKPEAMAALWEAPHWTLAVIDELKPSVNLTEGRLKWVIGNGMPLRPDFQVWVNDGKIESRLAKGAHTSWDLDADEVKRQFAAEWAKARANGRVAGEYEIVPTSATVDSEPALKLPQLGIVQADVHLFDQSMLKENDPDQPRSYGFFLLVRGRLINGDDDKGLLGLKDPSYGTFYRSQYIIRADGLDEDLLADREHLRFDTPRTRELGVLRDALYLASRRALEEYDERKAQERESASLLPVESRDFFREPLTALLMRHGETTPAPFDPTAAARIEHAPLDPAEPIATVNYAGGGFTVNSAHPLMSTIQEKLGEGKKARELLRTLDLFAVSEPLFEGFLYDLGIPDDQIKRMLAWRDGLLRAMALRYSDAPTEQVAGEVKEASYLGNKLFEDALAKLFRVMGFEAERDGASGQKDVLVVAPIGERQFRFTVEAKGSKGSVENDAAEVSAAAAHRDAVNAQHAVIVAREFKGFDREPAGRPAILKECESTAGVSIVTVEALAELCDAVRTYHYSLDDILPILVAVESPHEKRQRVRQLQRPTEDFDYRGVLDAIWNSQQKEAAGDMVSYRTLWQVGPNRWGTTLEDFSGRLIALETLSGHLLQVNETERTVTLRQSPEIVAECIQHAVEFRQKQVRTNEA